MTSNQDQNVVKVTSVGQVVWGQVNHGEGGGATTWENSGSLAI